MAETRVLRIVLDAVDNNVGSVIGGASSALSGLGAVGSTVATGGLALAAAGVAAVGAAAVGTGVSMLNLSSDIDQAQRDIRAQLGLTESEAEQLGGVVTDVFKNNFAASIPDATAAVIEARQQLGALADEELSAATQSALAMRDAFGVEVSESLNAAKVLMEQFGVSQEEAFDLMAGGFQRGLNSSDDFLDSITEYGNLFAENNATADEFFSVLETGLQGGVLGTDKIADAFKEFGIRMRESGEFSGDLTADFERVRTELLAMEDPVARNAAGVELFGTMWEDLGESAILGIDTTQTKMADLEGSTADLAAQYENWGSLFSGIWRQSLVALEPISGALLDLANSAMPKVQAAFEFIAPHIERFGAWMAEKIPQALGALQPYFQSLKAVLDEFGRNLLPVLTESWNTLYNTFTTQIRPALANLFQSFGQLMGETSGWDAVLKILRTTLSFIPPAIRLITNILSTWWSILSFGINTIAQFVDGIRSMKRAAEAVLAPLQRVANRISELISSALSMPDWLIPGSPTPFEQGLRGIGKAINAMPDLALPMPASPSLPATALAGGGVMSAARPQVSNSWQITIQANDEAGGRRAATGFLEEMRSRGLM